MRFHVLACDYDGTLAHHGAVAPATLEALRRLQGSGRKLVLVTGRRLDDLESVFPELGIFDRVVAENGALLYAPASREAEVLAEPPPPGFVEALLSRGVDDVAVGRCIVATWQPHAQAVLDAIQALGLELQVIFNKGAVMVLPTGVNKATGLAAALARLGLSPHNAVGVGDAENDHALLAACELGVAVGNALPALSARADLVTTGHDGAGVAELCERLIANDLADVALARHDLPLGVDAETGEEARLPVHGASLLVAGTSGGGKSTAVTGIVERMAQRGYQHVIIDPEGDYSTYDPALVLGEAHRAPTVDEVVAALTKPEANVVVNLFGLSLALRPAFFAALLPALHELRARFGRPHWIVVDEAHHLLPGTSSPEQRLPPGDLAGFLMVTVHPEHVRADVVAAIDYVLAIGKTPRETLREFANAGGTPAPSGRLGELAPGEGFVWQRSAEAPPRHVRPLSSRIERQRHIRKYAEGDLGPDNSFYFRGPEGKLNLQAQNLQMFLQLSDGVDADTWFHHLRAGDYSRWARERIKDDDLAAEVEAVEREAGDDVAASRAAVRHAIEARYTAPASPLRS
jgi:HAD superfamily hydrolase (TIGR01484 family)